MLAGGRSVVEAQASTKTIDAGAFCACGAWRGQLGLEPTPELFTEHMVEVFEGVRRVLRADGVLWMNLGDSYATGAGGADGRGYRGDRLDNGRGDQPAGGRVKTRADRDGTHAGKNTAMAAMGPMTQPNRMRIAGLKPKDMVGIPWMVAFALRGAGWWLRADVIWHKPNPMPEAVTDRPTKAHEYLFLLTKSQRYHYDADAIREPVSGGAHARGNGVNPKATAGKNEESGDRRKDGFNERWRVKQNASFSGAVNELVDFRNRRSVWTIPTQPNPDAHFATFPEDLVTPCILAGCPGGGVVLDPFGGSGTVARVAEDLGRRWVLFDLNPEYAAMARRRTSQQGLLGRLSATDGAADPIAPTDSASPPHSASGGDLRRAGEDPSPVVTEQSEPTPSLVASASASEQQGGTRGLSDLAALAQPPAQEPGRPQHGDAGGPGHLPDPTGAVGAAEILEIATADQRGSGAADCKRPDDLGEAEGADRPAGGLSASPAKSALTTNEGSDDERTSEIPMRRGWQDRVRIDGEADGGERWKRGEQGLLQGDPERRDQDGHREPGGGRAVRAGQELLRRLHGSDVEKSPAPAAVPDTPFSRSGNRPDAVPGGDSTALTTSETPGQGAPMREQGDTGNGQTTPDGLGVSDVLSTREVTHALTTPTPDGANQVPQPGGMFPGPANVLVANVNAEASHALVQRAGHPVNAGAGTAAPARTAAAAPKRLRIILAAADGTERPYEVVP